MSAIFWLINTVLTLALWVIIIQVVLSWLINFNVINIRQPFVYQIWQGLGRLTDPLYRRIRRFMPDLGGIDLAPMVIVIAILFLQRLIMVDLRIALLS